MKNEIHLPNHFNIFDLTHSLRDYVAQNEKSKEYSKFAVQAMIDTIAEWSNGTNFSKHSFSTLTPTLLIFGAKQQMGQAFANFPDSFLANSLNGI
ncbi:MAG: hypothetical protein R3D58_13140 [Saprospiraceae bacterium]